MSAAEQSRPAGEMDPGCGSVHGLARPGTTSRHPDPLVVALARYIEALDRRYPGGPEQLRREALAGRANITPMSDVGNGRHS